MSEQTAPVTNIVVRINGKDRNVPDGLTVRALLEFLGLQPSLVVVELNREILKRDDHARVQVTSGDELELVHFVGGG